MIVVWCGSPVSLGFLSVFTWWCKLTVGIPVVMSWPVSLGSLPMMVVCMPRSEVQLVKSTSSLNIFYQGLFLLTWLLTLSANQVQISQENRQVCLFFPPPPCAIEYFKIICAHAILLSDDNRFFVLSSSVSSSTFPSCNLPRPYSKAALPHNFLVYSLWFFYMPFFCLCLFSTIWT